MSPDDVKMHGFQVEVGEPVFFLRGNNPRAVKLVQHYLSMLPVDSSVPAEQLMEVANLANSMQDWHNKRKAAT